MSKADKRRKRRQEKLAWAVHKQQKRLQALAERNQDRFPLKMVGVDEVKERSCGGCTACCFAVGVHELEKPGWTNCEHQCEQGCSIYSERPKSCRNYYCLWQGGQIRDEEARPDKFGIIFDYLEVPDKRDPSKSVSCVCAWELWEGAAENPKVREYLLAVARQVAGKAILYIQHYRSARRTIVARKWIV